MPSAFILLLSVEISSFFSVSISLKFLSSPPPRCHLVLETAFSQFCEGNDCKLLLAHGLAVDLWSGIKLFFSVLSSLSLSRELLASLAVDARCAAAGFLFPFPLRSLSQARRAQRECTVNGVVLFQGAGRCDGTGALREGVYKCFCHTRISLPGIHCFFKLLAFKGPFPKLLRMSWNS